MKHVLYFCVLPLGLLKRQKCTVVRTTVFLDVVPRQGRKRDNDYKCFLNYLHSFSSLTSFTKYKHVTGIIALLLCHPSHHIFSPTIIVIMLQGLYISLLCLFLKKFIINSFALFRILLFLLQLLLNTSIPLLINVWLVNFKQQKKNSDYPHNADAAELNIHTFTMNKSYMLCMQCIGLFREKKRSVSVVPTYASNSKMQ